jgi:hypothetical protein
MREIETEMNPENIINPNAKVPLKADSKLKHHLSLQDQHLKSEFTNKTQKE